MGPWDRKSSLPTPHLYTMSQGRCRLAIPVFNDSPDTVYSVSSLPPPTTPMVPLQNVSPNKRRFNTVENAAVAQRSHAKRQRTGPHTIESFEEGRKLHQIR